MSKNLLHYLFYSLLLGGFIVLVSVHNYFAEGCYLLTEVNLIVLQKLNTLMLAVASLKAELLLQYYFEITTCVNTIISVMSVLQNH